MRKYWKKLLVLFYLFLFLIVITGCWDNLDITDRAFVSAIGLDKGKNGQVEVTLQIIKPNVIRESRQGGSGESVIWSFTTTGETVFDGIREQLKTVNRKPFYSHIRLIIIGEDLAREGVRDILDFFVRDQEIKITPKLLVTRNVKAKEIVNATSLLEVIPALHLEGILENNISEAKTRNVEFIKVLQELTAPHASGVIGSVMSSNKAQITQIKDLEIEGAGVLKKDRLVGFLDENQIRGYLWIKDEIKGGVMVIENPIEKGKKITIEIKESTGKIDAEIGSGELILKIQVKMLGSINEYQGSRYIESGKLINLIEKAVEREIESNVEETIKVAQKEFKIDFIGFGNKVFQHYNNYWEEISENWDEVFSQLPVEISVDATIRRTGITEKPIPIR